MMKLSSAVALLGLAWSMLSIGCSSSDEPATSSGPSGGTGASGASGGAGGAGAAGGNGDAGDGGQGGGMPNLDPTSAVIGPEGGVLPLPGGGEVTVPPDALEEETTLGAQIVDADAPGVPTLPDWADTAGYVYEITPHELRSEFEMTFSIPSDADVLMHAAVGSEWEPLYRVSSDGSTLSAELASFSYLVPVSQTCAKAEAHNQALQVAFLDILRPAQECPPTCDRVMRLPEVEHPNLCAPHTSAVDLGLLEGRWHTHVDFMRIMPDACNKAAFVAWTCTDAVPSCSGGECTLGDTTEVPHSPGTYVKIRSRPFTCGDWLLNDGTTAYLYNAHETETVEVTVDITQTSSVDPDPSTITVTTLVPPKTEVLIASPSIYLSCSRPPFNAGTISHEIMDVAYCEP